MSIEAKRVVIDHWIFHPPSVICFEILGSIMQSLYFKSHCYKMNFYSSYCAVVLTDSKILSTRDNVSSDPLTLAVKYKEKLDGFPGCRPWLNVGKTLAKHEFPVFRVYLIETCGLLCSWS